jgi:uncharacterized protein (TIGR00251 family)
MSTSDLDLAVLVRPGSSRTEVGGTHDGRLVVRTTARAIDGHANEAVVRALAASFGVARSAVTIAHGLTSRRKLIRIHGPIETIAATAERLRSLPR